MSAAPAHPTIGAENAARPKNDSSVDSSEVPGIGQASASVAETRGRYLCLSAGVTLSMFAVGGRWDLPLAAWLAPMFLLRFSRLSKPATAIVLVWLTSIAASLFWTWELAVPMQFSTVAGGIVLGTVFSLPYVLDRILAQRLSLTAALLLFPAAIAVSEFVMGVFSPLGTAYGLAAVTQYADLPLLQIISITGPYGIGFLIGGFATVANAIWEKGLATSGAVRAGIAYAALLLAIIVGGQARMAFFPPSAEYVRLAGISPSTEDLVNLQNRIGLGLDNRKQIAQADPVKVRAAFDAINEKLLGSTRRAADAGARVVVWSENAAMLLDGDAPEFLSKAASVAREKKIYLEVADNVYSADPPYGRDETHLIGPSGNLLWTYQKAHPVPGFESYEPGDGRAPRVRTPYGRLSSVICYDADFPSLMRVPADIMLVPGGDWPQMGRVHTLRMASLRAIESGYSLLRQDYNGLSAAFDFQGHVLAIQDTTTPGDHLMLVDLPAHGTRTVYREIGDVFAAICAGIVLLLIGLGLVGRTDLNR